MKFDVNRAYCISIKNRQDRQRLASSNLESIENKTDFWLVEKDNENPERGCYNSHRNIALYGLENNLDRILVFEDDVEFIRAPSLSEMKRFNNHLASNTGELFYLGAVLGDIWPTIKWGVVGSKVFCAQSYIINREGMKKLASLPYAGMPIDVVFNLKFDSYMAFPMLTSQVAHNIISSDIASSRSNENNLNSDFWSRNRTSQYISLVKNLHKAF